MMKSKNAIITAMFFFGLSPSCFSENGSFIHPGALNTADDFKKTALEVKEGHQPWSSDFALLRSNAHDSPDYTPHPVAVLYRGTAAGHPKENYALLFNDAAAAYALALDWRLSGDDSRAKRAVYILTQWAEKLRSIDGTSDKFLAAGLYGYQLAVAAETLRGSSDFSASQQKAIRNMLVTVFAPMNIAFLEHHNGAKTDHYWANWDLSSTASLMAIGIYADRKDFYEKARHYYLDGNGNGALRKAAWKVYPDGLVQWQESGRDQAHTLLGIGLAGTICQLAWNQGDDLFGAYNNRLLGAARYVARYNSGISVPYTVYHNSDVAQSVISDKGRGEIRPVWALLYGHYVQLMHLSAPEIKVALEKEGLEGGGGNYGPNSGGYDQLGYGTLTFLN
ncbi:MULTISPECIES: alginate lyase family protein [Pantoea]|jgi:hypothetical protein|uniref:alginate lyase family protein n=1 Tax=Pantoea TaxID=53335 RepID=UPI000232341F|nr:MULTISPECIES: alginate lyase family protein [Pantoea]AER33065.1 exopolysaccharide inner membrane protein [Pantoea ananatis PA13]AWQ19142.1 cell wall anchor protein [Pantoea ananatis]MCS3401474.1 alginate lyase family protein [Pantoea sp. B566]MDC7863690.1 cell wall anchor protein [Pantoea ananatis]MDC7869885.1 cell wall anchor protein [Pantoea ananatis]